MPITFGSVGDIISLSLLIKDLVKSLDNSRGSSADYQAVIRELWSLDHALLEVEALIRSCEQTVQLNALNATVNQCAEQCRKCVADFHEHVRKFGRSLQPGGSGSRIRDTAAKVRWQISEKEDLAKFRAEIHAHCFSINMLLTTTGVFNPWSRYALVYGEDMVSVDEYLDNRWICIHELTVRMVCRNINLSTYQATMSLQTSIPAQLERFWTQEPATLEDALGRVTPTHLEFLDCWEAFEAVLEVRFRQLPGHRKVQRKEYTLLANSSKKDIGPSLAFTRCFLPGQRIHMSMMFDNGSKGLDSCPGCKLATSGSEEEFDSQVQWCKMWYRQVMETSATEPASTIETLTQLRDPRSKRQWIDEMELDDDPAQFRRVCLRYWDHKPEYSGMHKEFRGIIEHYYKERPSEMRRAIEHVDSGLADMDLAWIEKLTFDKSGKISAVTINNERVDDARRSKYAKRSRRDIEHVDSGLADMALAEGFFGHASRTTEQRGNSGFI
ncbi:MAG: hypothetical protein Q9161_001043 [Pseudevernia consocians]